MLVSLSLCLSPGAPVSAQMSLGLQPAFRTMSVGVVVRESPQGGGSCSATHPAYQTVPGEGKEVEMQTAQPRLLLTETLSHGRGWGAGKGHRGS